MSVNLNEFTSKQLAFYIEIMKEKIKDINYEISALAFWEDTEMRDNHLKERSEKLDDALLLRIQLDNALSEVTEREKEFSH